MSVSSLAIEGARRAAKAALNAPLDNLGQTNALASLFDTITHEAWESGADAATRIDALTRGLVICIHNATTDAAAARALLKSANLMAASQLEFLLALNTPRNRPARGDQ